MIRNCCSVILTLFIITIISCKQGTQEKASTAMDTGREFIRASLNGDFETAGKYILKDSQNVQLFDSYKTFYGKLPEEKKEGYRKASYEINKYLDLDDSTTIINYSNDYMNKPMDIKIIRKDKQWWVDFKYTYSGNLPID